MTLEKNTINTIEACRYCPMCRHVCSSEFLSFRESDTPRGRAILLQDVYMGKADYEETVIDAIYNCLLCGCCWSWCAGRDEGGYNIPELIKDARVDIVNKGVAPDIAVKIKNSILKDGNPYSISMENSFSFSIKEKDSNALYYLGSDINFKNKEIAQAFIKILKNTREDFTVFDDECSGGKILSILGFIDDAKIRAEGLYKKIKRINCKSIIISDPLDYDFIKNDFKKFGFIIDDSIKIIHTSEYLAKKIKNNEIILKKSREKATIVDSEYLGRFNGIYNAPREVIKASVGSGFTEMEWSGEKMLSTGEAAMIFQSQIFDKGSKLGKKICDMAKEKSIKILITLSPAAKNNIKSTCESNMSVIDIAEFVNDRINLRGD
jgi:Fe-S oxidoreductase